MTGKADEKPAVTTADAPAAAGSGGDGAGDDDDGDDDERPRRRKGAGRGKHGAPPKSEEWRPKLLSFLSGVPVGVLVGLILGLTVNPIAASVTSSLMVLLVAISTVRGESASEIARRRGI